LADRVRVVEPPGAAAPTMRHSWVTDNRGRLPGLLLEWRKVASGDWQSRVVRPALDDDRG